MYANRLIVPEMVDTPPKPVMHGERGGGGSICMIMYDDVRRCLSNTFHVGGYNASFEKTSTQFTVRQREI